MHAGRTLPGTSASESRSGYHWRVRQVVQRAPITRTPLSASCHKHTCSMAQPANSGHAKRHRPAQCRAATVPAPPPPPPSESGQDYEAYQQLLLELSTRKSFEELRLFLDKHQAAFSGASSVYALLQAANLRSTIDVEALEPGMAGMQVLMEAEAVLTLICDALRGHVKELPLDTQAAVVMALAQLDFYEAEIYAQVAQTAAAGPLQCAPQALANNLSLLCCAFALAGHYDAALMDALGLQVAQTQALFRDVKNLVNISAAFLDLQHYSGPLLQAVADAALAQRDKLDLDDMLSLALIMAFFKAGRQDLLGAAVARLEQAQAGQLSAKNVDFLQKLLLLAQGQMQPSPKLQQLLEAGLQQHGAALAARPRPGLLDEEMLAAVEAAGGPQVFEMMGQSGFLTNAQLFQTLQGLGFTPRRGEAAAEGLLPVHMALQVQDTDVAVQILTEVQYCKNEPARLKGQAAAELLCLEMLGWVVLPVATSEWVELKGQEGRQSYIVQRLKAVTS